MTQDEIAKKTRFTITGDQKYSTTARILLFNEPNFQCPTHGEIGNTVIHSTLKGYEMNLCLYCYLEKMVEIGVCKVTEKVRGEK